MTDQPRIGLIGAGIMGKGLGRNLMAAGYSLTVTDTDATAVARMRDIGAAASNGVAGLASSSDVIGTCLPSLDAIQNVFEGDGGIIANCRAGHGRDRFLDQRPEPDAGAGRKGGRARRDRHRRADAEDGAERLGRDAGAAGRRRRRHRSKMRRDLPGRVGEVLSLRRRRRRPHVQASEQHQRALGPRGLLRDIHARQEARHGPGPAARGAPERHVGQHHPERRQPARDHRRRRAGFSPPMSRSRTRPCSRASPKIPAARRWSRAPRAASTSSLQCTATGATTSSASARPWPRSRASISSIRGALRVGARRAR